jgi:Tol biopolymer transport system component
MGAAAAEAVEADIGAESGMCAAEAWSPSGQKVAVVCWFGTDRDTGYSYRDRGEAELWVADGSGGIRRISPERGIYVDPVWSQDEQQLLVCGDALRVFDTATVAPPNTILEIPLGYCYNATWRPR